MKAITVKYFGPGNVRGSRLIASDSDGNRKSVPYPDEGHSYEDKHFIAVQALCAKMGWGGEVVCGWMKTADREHSVWVFIDNGGSNRYMLPRVERKVRAS